MKSKRTILTTAAVAATALSLAVFLPGLVAAQWGHGHGRGPHGPHGPGGFEGGFMLGRMVGELDLTEEQREAFHDLMIAHHEERKGDIEALQTARLALMEQTVADVLDEGAIRAASADVASVEADLAVARAEFLQQVRGILAPEQWEEAKALFAEHREELKRRRAEYGESGGWGHGRKGGRRTKAPVSPSQEED
jgi:Spy/CpxP family protein refolding chaperone